MILFDQSMWLIFAMPFAGLIAAALSKRQDPVIKGKRILRHDIPARVSHWTHALGTTLLLVSGIILGTRFTPSFVDNDAATALWFNVHFVFALLFLFGTFYWLGNTIVSKHRFREHLPTKNAIKYTVHHYGHLLGIKRFALPPEGKYFESERMAFILAVAATLSVGLTGLVKVAAHAISLPEGFMNTMTWIHDVSAAAMLLFFIAHVFFAAIAPFSWKTLKSMFTGYMPLKHAEEEHGGWVAELETNNDVENTATKVGGTKSDESESSNNTQQKEGA